MNLLTNWIIVVIIIIAVIAGLVFTHKLKNPYAADMAGHSISKTTSIDSLDLDTTALDKDLIELDKSLNDQPGDLSE